MEQSDTIDWPAWGMAVIPLILLTSISSGFGHYTLAVINLAFWLADYYLNRKSGIQWITVIAAVILPPFYLGMRAKTIPSSKNIFILSLVVLVVVLAIGSTM